jgi:hypothetical protein
MALLLKLFTARRSKAGVIDKKKIIFIKAAEKQVPDFLSR